MPLPPDLAPPAVDGGFVARLGRVKAQFVAVGDVILREVDQGTWEPALGTTVLRDMIGILLDSDDAKKWLAELSGAPRFWHPYTDVLRTWVAWQEWLTKRSGHDLCCLLAVREVLLSFAGQTWSITSSGSENGASTVSIGVGGGAGGSASAGMGTYAPVVSRGTVAGQLYGGTISATGSRSGNASGSITGDIGASAGNTTSKSAGSSWAIGQHLVPTLQALDLCIASESATGVLATATVMDLLRRGLMTPADAEERVRLNGDDWEEQLRALPGSVTRASAAEYVQWAKRTGQTEEWIAARLRTLGVADTDDLRVLRELFESVPSPAEVERAVGRRLDDNAVVNRYGLHDRLAESLGPPWGAYLASQGVGVAAWTAAWEQHWDMGGVSRAEEAIRRLAPDLAPPGLEFTEDDFTKHCRLADVPEWWIPRLRYLATRPIGFRQINQLVSTGQLNQDQARDRWRALGFHPEDAVRLATAGQRQAAALAASQGHGFTAAEIVKLLTERAMTRETATGWLQRLFLTPNEIDTIFERVAAEQAGQLRKQHVAALETAYVHGGIDTPAAQDALVRQGYSAGDASETIQIWTLRRTQHAHPVGRAELVHWLQQGLLTADQFVNRLLALGEPEVDARATLASVLLTMRAAQQKAASAQLAKAATAAQKAQTALSRARSAAARAAAHLSKLRAQKVNAEEHGAFVQEQAQRVQETKDLIDAETDKTAKKKAVNALARAVKTDTAIEQEAERLRLLGAEGAPPGP